MSPSLPQTALALLLSLGVGCGSDVLIGRSCDPGGCGRAALEAADDRQEGPFWPVLAPPSGDCAVQLATGESRVPPGGELERCELFTLDALSSPQGGLYLTRGQVLMTPTSHHADIRLAPEIPGFPDGEVDCDRLWASSTQWLGLMAARGERSVQNLAAPFAISSRYRVLINHHYFNTRTSEASEVGILLNLTCTTDVPSAVSQPFAFEERIEREVLPGRQLTVVGEAVFSKAVRVTEIYRRTHRIEEFVVERWNGEDTPGDAGLTTPIWETRTNATPWRLALSEPLEFEAGEGFRWSCTYINTGDDSFGVGGPNSDACVLLGIYQLPDGAFDPEPERHSIR